jgi:hypothetical protein
MSSRRAINGALIALTASIGLCGSARAVGITTDQWYAFQFVTVGNPVSSPSFTPGTDGPLPGGGTGNAIDTASATSWTVTLSTPGYVVFTDLGNSGDQFQVSVNGVAATPTTNNLTPSGQLGLAGGLTSNPCVFTGSTCTTSVGQDIALALANADFSSGTFFLPAGTDTITAILYGTISPGNGAFLVATATPLPAALPLFATGLGGLGLLGWRRKRKQATA